MSLGLRRSCQLDCSTQIVCSSAADVGARQRSAKSDISASALHRLLARLGSMRAASKACAN
eukprot:6202187-Pleurochrysis_carterae.AAC.2